MFLLNMQHFCFQMNFAFFHIVLLNLLHFSEIVAHRFHAPFDGWIELWGEFAFLAKPIYTTCIKSVFNINDFIRLYSFLKL